METENLSFLIAFGAGIVSFISPCVLPLVPAYVSHLAGTTVEGQFIETTSRSKMLFHAMSFVLGFTFVFVLLGASVGVVGFLFSDFVPMFRRLGGLVLIIFGLHVMGILQIPFLYRDARFEVSGGRQYGLLMSFLVGTTFAFGWTPCVGPILSAILLLASTAQTVLQGSLLLVAYSLGLGVPFLVTGLALGMATKALRRMNKYMGLVSAISGVFLIIMGIVFILDLMPLVSRYFGYIGT